MTFALDDGVLATVARSADESEANRRLADEAMAALVDSGLLRLLVPARVGGTEGSLAEMVAAVRTLGTVDGAASWVAMVLLAHDWILGSFSEDAQDEVYADGPDTIVPGSLAPAGAATEVDGGWQISGRWPFASGAHHGHFYLLGSREPAAAATDVRRPRLVHLVVPRSDVAIDDTWHPLGLRGTGSCDVVADDTFVPRHRAMDSGELLAGRGPWSDRHRTNLYKTPILPGLAAHVAASTVGIAQGGLADAVDRYGTQRDAYLGSAKADRAGVQMRLAASTSELRSAELLLDDAVSLLVDAAAGDDSRPLRARAKYQASHAIEIARRSLARVVNAAGGRAVFDATRLQRAFRDVTMASQHAVSDLDEVGIAYGRTLLGQPPGNHPL